MKMSLVAPILMLAVSPVAASAANVLDQQQNNAPTPMAGFSQTNLAQSFQTSASNVSGGGVYLVPGDGSGGGTVTFGLWTALPNAAGATELASGTSAILSAGQFVDAFWAPVAVTPGATYYLTFDSPSSYVVDGDVSNPYPRGNVYANSGYQAFPSYDYTFHTFTATGAPEPASWALMLVGVGVAGGVMRRCRRTLSTAA